MGDRKVTYGKRMAIALRSQWQTHHLLLLLQLHLSLGVVQSHCLNGNGCSLARTNNNNPTGRLADTGAKH